MLPQLLIQAVPTHILTGFLGAGKTTLLRHLLAQKPANEVWAVLVNEFGQIGLDGVLLDTHDQGIAIREVAGGCLCCTSQLPMQIGLARLLGQAKPDRLFIEPTGLGHPKQLIEQLTESHWQQSLQLKAVLTVLDGTRLHDSRLREHESFMAQLMAADIVVVSHHAEMQAADHAELAHILAALPAPQRQVLYTDQGQSSATQVTANQIGIMQIDQPRHSSREVRRSLLHAVGGQRLAAVSAGTTGNSNTDPTGNPEVSLPYHYVEQSLGHAVGGWRLPPEWQFDRAQLLDWLFSLQDWQRIKGVIQVEDGWVAINLIPDQIQLTSHAGGADNRLELITAPDADWLSIEAGLMACLLNRVDAVQANPLL